LIFSVTSFCRTIEKPCRCPSLGVVGLLG